MSPDEIELTAIARWRKLFLCTLAAVLMTAVQVKAGGISTIYVIGMLVDMGAFVCADVLDKALQTGALGKLSGLVKPGL